MNISFELIEDKVEFFEAGQLKTLEKKIDEQIQHNKAIMLHVHNVQHHVSIDENGRRLYTAVVHFKVKKQV
ncbi:DUF2536 family protein [Bacillus haikouensis]|jgi:hypothetical protein|uniref:DUF2536 family protein n=1 Tax=Bacillus haikouensis TaxID=1510468 RepID=UPI0015573CA9|nr:DUF2536 family protein [Bacillus haikouensis]NQD65506.1 DUF2536 family protein [Bacillus haikouensis]